MFDEDGVGVGELYIESNKNTFLGPATKSILQSRELIPTPS